MHLSTFASRQITSGWVVDATKADGRVEQLVGLYNSQAAATTWIAEHPAAWWVIHPTAAVDENTDFIRVETLPLPAS